MVAGQRTDINHGIYKSCRGVNIMKKPQTYSNAVVNLGNGRIMIGKIVSCKEDLPTNISSIKLPTKYLKDAVAARLAKCIAEVDCASMNDRIICATEQQVLYKRNGIICHYSFQAADAMREFLEHDISEDVDPIVLECIDPYVILQVIKAVENYSDPEKYSKRVILDILFEVYGVSSSRMYKNL